MGIADVLLGVAELSVQINLLFFVYPKLSLMYRGLNAELPLISRLYPFLSVGLIFVMLSIVLLGFKLIYSKNQSEIYVKWGIIGFILLLILLFLSVGASAVSVIFPIYNLTTSL